MKYLLKTEVKTEVIGIAVNYNMEKALYTKPVLCSTSEEWYIYFSFYHAGKWYDVKRREGINRIKKISQKRIEAEGLVEARYMWLKEGWNPIIDPKFKLQNIKTESAAKQMLLCDALEFALSKKKLAKKSLHDYSNILKHVRTSASNMGYDYLPISMLERFNIMELMDRLQSDRKLSNHAYNKYLDCIRAMLTVLETRQAIKYNPASKIPHLRTPESNKYISLDEDEKARVTGLLYQKHFNFFVYIQVIYYTGIRPKEVLALRISDIDFKKQEIIIVPDLSEENSKTLSVRHVTVANQLLVLLKEMKLDNYPPDYYLFGSPFSAGRGNSGGGSIKLKSGEKVTGAMRPDFLSPSPNHVKRDTVTRLWKTLVMEELGINKHLYALKHTGTDDKIIAGIDLDTLRGLYGHSDKHTTERYTKRIKEVYKKEILEKSPDFSNAKNG
jgi:integrase